MFGLNPRLKVVKDSVRGFEANGYNYITGFRAFCPTCNKETGWVPLASNPREGSYGDGFSYGPGGPIDRSSDVRPPSNLFGCNGGCGSRETLKVELPKEGPEVVALPSPEPTGYHLSSAYVRDRPDLESADHKKWRLRWKKDK